MATKAKPSDVTGRKREEMMAQNADQIQARANEISLATAQAIIDEENEIIDATSPASTTVVVDQATKVGAESDTVVIRTVETIEAMTYGAGNLYTFIAGKKYEVSRKLANHLASKGYLANTL